MGITRPKPEEIVVKLRQVEVLTGQGIARLDAIQQIGVTEQTYYRWKKKYGGMGAKQSGIHVRGWLWFPFKTTSQPRCGLT